MKRNYLMTLATVAICLLSTPVLADDAAKQSTHPAGTFYWTQDYGQGETDNWLVLDVDGESVSGTYVQDDISVPVQDGEYKDGKFKFKLELEIDGTEIVAMINGAVEGDKISAITEVELDGNSQEFDLEATRKTRPEDVVGTWNLSIDAEGQTFEPVAKITQDGDELKVEYLTDEFGDHEAVDISLKDNKLSYTIAVDSPEGSMKLKFDTMPRGNNVAGTVEYEVGDITGSADVEGEREPVASDLSGTWAMVIDAEGQTFEPTMKVSNADGKLAIEYLTDEFGDHEATDIKQDGDKLNFTIAADSPEGSLKLMFALKADGDKIDGEVEYEVGDITGTADIEGEREAAEADLAGTWAMTIDAEGQTFEPTMKVSNADGKLAIEYLTDEFGDHEAVEISQDGDKLNFTIAADSPEGSLKLTFALNVDGDKIDGEVEYEVGDITGTADIEGEKE